MITMEDARSIMNQVFIECNELRGAGQKEYAHDTENALRNFESLAKELNLSRESVLWVYCKKHLDGILAYINGHRSQRESVKGRINDVIVYLTLLRCMVEDDERNQSEQKEVVQASDSKIIEEFHEDLERPRRTKLSGKTD